MQLLCNSTEAPAECINILIRHDIQTQWSKSEILAIKLETSKVNHMVWAAAVWNTNTATIWFQMPVFISAASRQCWMCPSYNCSSDQSLCILHRRKLYSCDIHVVSIPWAVHITHNEEWGLWKMYHINVTCLMWR
jgi:hypothetical protein